MNQVIKRENFTVNQIEKKQSFLDLEQVQEKLSRTELRIAKTSTGISIRDIPDRDLYIEGNEEKDRGLVSRTGILARGIARDYSIRNVEKSEAFRFFDILKKYYSNFTLDEIRSAFELALVGDLDAYLPKDKNGNPDKNHYQTFSVEFITKILNAYKSYKGKIWGKVYSIQGSISTEPTEEQKQESRGAFVAMIQALYLEYLEGKEIDILFPTTIADFLIEKGWVEDRELNDKDFNRAMLNISSDKNANIFLKVAILESYQKGEKDKLRAEAQSIKSMDLILEAFEKMKIRGIKF